MRVHNRRRIALPAHRARAAGVVQRGQGLADEGQDLRIGLQGRVRAVQRAGGDAARVGDLPDTLEAGDGQFLVDGREEPVGADDGVHGCGRAVDGDVSAGGEGEDGGGDDEVVARVVVGDVGEGSGEGDDLEVGPVTGVG